MILLYNNYRSFSISSREGIEFAVPIRVVEIPAKVLANLIASKIDFSSQRAVAKAPEKASPAPEVSITLDPVSYTHLTLPTTPYV